MRHYFYPDRPQRYNSSLRSRPNRSQRRFEQPPLKSSPHYQHQRKTLQVIAAMAVILPIVQPQTRPDATLSIMASQIGPTSVFVRYVAENLKTTQQYRDWPATSQAICSRLPDFGHVELEIRGVRSCNVDLAFALRDQSRHYTSVADDLFGSENPLIVMSNTTSAKRRLAALRQLSRNRRRASFKDVLEKESDRKKNIMRRSKPNRAMIDACIS